MDLTLIRHAAVDTAVAPGEAVTVSSRGRADSIEWAKSCGASGRFEAVSACYVSALRRARETADQIGHEIALPTFVIDPRLNEIGENDETLENGITRVVSLLDELAAMHVGESIVAITHAGVIVTSLLGLFGIPRDARRAWLEPGFLSMTRWIHADDRWTLESYNVTLDRSPTRRTP